MEREGRACTVYGVCHASFRRAEPHIKTLLSYFMGKCSGSNQLSLSKHDAGSGRTCGEAACAGGLSVSEASGW